MFGEITVNKMVEVTAKDLKYALNSLEKAYVLLGDIQKRNNSEVLKVILVYVADTYIKINDWNEYYSKINHIITDKIESDNEEIVRLKEEVKLLNKEIERLNKLKDEPMDNKLKLLGEATDLIKEAKASVEHKAAMRTFNGRVKSGEVTPAKRIDVDDNFIRDKYNAGWTAYKIAKDVGMTQQAIIYRIKKLKETGVIQ